MLLTRFSAPLVEGRLIRRYKRFLSDVELVTGETVTAHCANPGSMLGLADPGARVWLSRSDNPKRKLAYSWELIEVDLGRGPRLWASTRRAPTARWPRPFKTASFPNSPAMLLRREVRYGGNSRIDILLEDEARPPCYVEIKNVHLMREAGLAEFPDSVTARGAKHLAALSGMVAAGAGRSWSISCSAAMRTRRAGEISTPPMRRPSARDRVRGRGFGAGFEPLPRGPEPAPPHPAEAPGPARVTAPS
ncbi:DNA/RNA nuclease SfsA [Methyloceanibacter methanicus]|uniref:DNA/RNA nuclease SfsA n=1 Tax=Methyloceanibacter methanicus TaxID=1774968 RepID=UPI0009F3F5FB|nr:DNA/RNA nuclease SfsA [Methyloceanibacter methanicus]